MLKFAAKSPNVSTANGEKVVDNPKLTADLRALEEENKRLKALVRAQHNSFVSGFSALSTFSLV